ncbi:phytohormone-binding protein-like [Prosopis cineraria]|uniref:phytohormone-binding protein-like n=1 Tax=Prosopis cineraria TaxID=364024 RepID=UPI00240FACC7|nr:phytohormone-binding protein-like [Prosopis cineraria]
MQVIEGDGGVGTILLITRHCSSGSGVRYQKERISELDATAHEIGFEYVQAGFLNEGFSYYKGSLQLSAKGEHQTVVISKVCYYELENEEGSTEKLKTVEPAGLNFLRSLAKHLSNGA